MVSWMDQMLRAQAEQAELDRRAADPLLGRVEEAVRGKQAISTAALLDLLGLRKTTGSARRVAKSLRTLGLVPIKSRRLVPGGFRDTVARGWARPVRKTHSQKPSTLVTDATQGDENACQSQ